MPFTESDIKNYRCHADAVIAEIYPLLKNAVSPHAATYIKKDMLRLKENGNYRPDPIQQQVIPRHADQGIYLGKMPDL